MRELAQNNWIINFQEKLSLQTVQRKLSKGLVISLLLCSSVTTDSSAANYYDNDFRSMPFIEMMATMIRFMNQVMGVNQNFSGLNALPYSAAFMPGSGMGGFGNLPMSPANFNTLQPFTNMANTSNLWSNDTKKGPNINAFNTLPNQGQNNLVSTNSDGLNGIWQAASGDVLAIYHDNHFLWSNGNSRNLAGRMVIKGNKMVAFIPSSNITLYFQFYMEPGQFVVRDQSSRMYKFKRIH